MKRFLLTGLSALLAVLLSIPVLAAEQAELVRAFVYEDTLYTYVELTDVTRPITKADATLGTHVFPASGTLETVRQAGSPVTYLLLVDCSNSMPDFQADIQAFAAELARTAGENTRFILATFGKDFTVLAEDLTADSLSAQIDTIAYTATQTRLHNSLGEMLDYFESLPRQGSELRSAVVLSDAVQYDPQGGVSYEEILDRISRSDVMVHSVGFGTDTGALEDMARLGKELTERICRSGVVPSIHYWTRGIESKAENAIHCPLLAHFLAPRYRRNRSAALGCNMSFFREDFIRINGYDEFYEGWGGEDIDLGNRLQNSGCQKRYLKFSGIVYHLWHEDKYMYNREKNFRHMEELNARHAIRCAQGVEQYL